MTFSKGVIVYTIIAIVLHCLFIAYIFMNRPIECIKLDPIQEEFEIFLVWAILYFPLLLFCAFYTLLFRMTRSFLCSCWQCCGNNIYSKGATKCKICFEGVFGNPLIFAICHIIWGVVEYGTFGQSCSFEIQYGSLADLIIVALSLILLCIYYYVKVKRKFEAKRNQNIADKYEEQQREDAQIAKYNAGGRVADVAMVGNAEENHYLGQEVRAPSFDREGAKPNRRYSAQPVMRQNVGSLSPAYAASAHGIAPYSAGDRRHSYNVNAQPKNQSPFQSPIAPAYAASAQGVAPYRPQSEQERRYSYQPSHRNSGNPLMDSSPIQAPSHQKQESASIEISIDIGDNEDDIIPSGHRTRGLSLSFPSQFKGHARRVSSGILDILKKIDAEPECSVCMCEFEKGDEMGQLECGHTFHKECIVEWLGNEASCPMCRIDMKR